MTRVLAALFSCTALLAGPADVGMNAAWLERSSARMQEFVNARSASGYVTLVARHGEIVHHSAVGVQDIKSNREMSKDSIFQVASMTKPITAAGIMILMEEGRLAVTDAVETHLPEFRGLTMVVSRDRNRVTLGPSPRKITIRELLTHTSGLPGGFPTALAEIFNSRGRLLAATIAVRAGDSLAVLQHWHRHARPNHRSPLRQNL